MRLRPADEDDLPALVALEALLFGSDAWSTTAVREELTAPGRRFVVAVADGGASSAGEAGEATHAEQLVVGYAATMRVGDVADLQRVAVHPRHQRRGVATRLLRELLARAAEDGAGQMLLEVSAANGAALGFYARAEFVEIDRRRRYYRDGSDAVVLRRDLGRAAPGEDGLGEDGRHGRG